MITGIILAGSAPWNDDPLAKVCPHGLLPVANRAMVARSLDWFRRQGIRSVVVCVNTEAESIIGFVDRCGFGDLRLYYNVDRVPRGPAGCVRDASELAPAPTYVVTEISVIPLVDAKGLLATHRETDAAVTILAAVRAPTDSARGLVEPSGVYVMADAAVSAIPDTSFQDIKEMMLTRLLKASLPLSIHRSPGATVRIRDLASYLVAQGAALRGGQPDWISDDYVRRGDAWIHHTARVDDSVQLVGELMIGPECVVAGGCVLIGPAVVGARSTLHSGSVLSRSVLLPGCRLDSDAHLDFSVAAAGARIAAGSRHYSTIMHS